MDPLSLFAVLLGIIVFSKVLAHGIKVVDVLFYIILGFTLTKLGVLESKSEIIHFLAEVGVLFLMFFAGWHEDSKTFIKKFIKNKWIAIIGAIGPFVGAYLGTYVLGFGFNESLVAGFIFTATAVPYTIGVLQSLKLDKTPAAKSIIAAAMADNFISIFFMSAVFATFVLLETGQGSISEIVIGTSIKLALLLLCFIVFFILATIIFPETEEDHKIHKGTRKFIIFVTNLFGLNWFTKKFYKVEILVPTILFLMIFLSMFSHFMGLHAAIGAYLTGLILNRDMFHHGDDSTQEIGHSSLTDVIYSIANHFLGPIFFIYLGTQLVIDFDNFRQIFWYGFVLFAFVASLQFLAAYFAAKYTASLSFKDSVLVGLGMWPRDVLAFVILGIAIKYNLISSDGIFGSVVVVAILILDIVAPICIKLWNTHFYRK